MKVTENELDNEFLSEASVRKIVRRTKRQSLIRMIIICGIVVPIMLLLLWFANAAILNHALGVVTREVATYEATMSPNVYIGAYSRSDGFLSAQFEFTTYKLVNHIPVPWNPLKVTYSFPFWQYVCA